MPQFLMINGKVVLANNKPITVNYSPVEHSGLNATDGPLYAAGGNRLKCY